MPNRTEARSAKAALTNATGRLPLLRLFSTPLVNASPNSALMPIIPPQSSISDPANPAARLR